MNECEYEAQPSMHFVHLDALSNSDLGLSPDYWNRYS
jgi:hypothetical protein